MPAFESTSGEYISEGSAIALYIALSAPASGLVPSTPVGQAQVAQWQGFVDFSVLTNLCAPAILASLVKADPSTCLYSI